MHYYFTPKDDKEYLTIWRRLVFSSIYESLPLHLFISLNSSSNLYDDSKFLSNSELDKLYGIEIGKNKFSPIFLKNLSTWEGVPIT